MQELKVSLGERSYPIFLAAGILDKSGELIRKISTANKVLLVSNPTVYDLYGQIVLDSLQSEGFKVSVALMPDGEIYKNGAEAFKILDKAVDTELERSSAVLALGGGVVGDLAGFVAAVYQRGVDFIQIPTTLLAQVDSSVGGKVAVNHPRGKNLIGAFHQPRMVIIDNRTLHTLEDREYCNGLGEVVKYGIVYDEDFFSFMESNADKIRAKDDGCLEEIIYKCCKIKSDIVAQDEREQGLRSILNLGHTFGHSIEKLGNYSLYKHGEAVVMGTIAAGYLALAMGFVSNLELKRIIQLYHNLGIYVPFPKLDSEEIYVGMQNDKKVTNNQLRLILPRGIGNYVIADDVSKEKIIQAIHLSQRDGSLG